MRDFRDDEAIAIIGMAGRFPGANSIAAFWKNLCDGVESIRDVTPEELRSGGVDEKTIADPRYVKRAADLRDAECFDAEFFGYLPRDAELMDPQHRVLLECAWAALESAGYDPPAIPGTVGVFCGVAQNDYLLHNLMTHSDLRGASGEYFMTLGNEKDYCATRIAYKLNLKGPAINVQSACSSSGVATHLACQSLINGDSDIALAGGARIHVPLRTGYWYTENGILSPDGRCRAFDAGANGVVRGSGVCLVVLKRLGDALSDGDHVHAVIQSTALSNDGATKVGFTAPSLRGQTSAILDAMALAGVTGDDIGYVETHGTGTAVGDPIEVAALTRAYRETSQRVGDCPIGSLKTNIGHLDAGAGAAGLIKAALSLENEVIPPSLNYERPNPQIDFEHGPFFVNSTLREWKRGGAPRCAGVSSLGLGGTNFHAILREAPAAPVPGRSRPWQLIPISAKSTAALDRITADLADHLRRQDEVSLADISFTLETGRHRFAQRRFVVARTSRDAAAALSDEPGTTSPVSRLNAPESGSPVFMFPGGGAQYTGMGRGLYDHEPRFRSEVDRCAEILSPITGADIRRHLYPRTAGGAVDGAVESDADRPRVALPLLFTIEYALAQLWMSWGVRPSAMIGHSLGEYAAACLSGVISLEQALELVALRGRLFEQLPAGSMLGVSLPEEAIRARLASDLSIAAVNRPDTCVVSGPEASIVALQAELERDEIECRRIHIRVAAHSQMVEPILEPFGKHLRQVTFHPPTIPYVSNVTGDWITEKEATSPEYWVRHLRETVHFSRGLETVLQDADRVLLESGPGQTLSTFARQHPARRPEQQIIASIRHPREIRDDLEFLLQSLGHLWAAGASIDWEGFYRGEQRRRVPLPTYSFERTRHWRNAAAGQTSAPPAVRADAPAVVAPVEAVVTSARLRNRRERIDEKVREVLHRLSGLDPSSFDGRASFLELGFDSLLLTRANTAFQKEFDVRITFRQLFEEAPSLDALAAYIDARLPSDALSTPSYVEVETAAAAASAPSAATASARDTGPARPADRKRVTLPAIKELLHRLSGLDPTGLGEQATFLEMGFDSLFLTRINTAIQKEFGVKVTFRQLFDEAPTLAALARYIDERRPASEEVAVAPEAAVPVAADRARTLPVDVRSQGHGPWKPIHKDSLGLTETQHRHVQELIARYTRRTAGSKRLTEAQRPRLADPRAVTGFHRIWKEMVYQIAVNRSSGSRIWDVDGNEYVDLVMGFGINIFGYSPAFVREAVEEQLADGVSLGVLTPKARAVADLFCQLARVDRVNFVNTGSEAVSAAVRAARTVTGRDRIAVFQGDYHGISDELLVKSVTIGGRSKVTPVAPGLPESLVHNVLVLDYEDPRLLDRIQAHAHELAAVIVEPVPASRPGFPLGETLHALREVTARHGIALVFDELITGFRVHQRGAQGFYGVDADLVSYGKVLSGGLPLAAVAGTSRFMDAFDGGMWNYGDDSFPEVGVTFFGGTFVRHPLSLCAALAVLKELERRGPRLQEDLNRAAERFSWQIADVLSRTRAPLQIQNGGSMLLLKVATENPLARLLFFSLREKGVHLTERAGFLSTEHSGDDLRFILRTLEESILEMKDAELLPECPEDFDHHLGSARPRLEPALETVDAAPTAGGGLAGTGWTVPSSSRNGDRAAPDAAAVGLQVRGSRVTSLAPERPRGQPLCPPSVDGRERRDPGGDRLIFTGMEPLDALRRRELALTEAFAIRGIDSYAGLAEGLDELCSAYVCAYFSSRGIVLRRGRSYDRRNVAEALGILPIYERFLDYMLSILNEDGIVQVNAARIDVLRDREELPDPGDAYRGLLARHPEFRGLLEVLKHCAEHYSEALSGEVPAISILFPEGRRDLLRKQLRESTAEHTNLRIYEQLAKEHVLELAGEAPLRILEVGGGGGDLTWQLVPRLPSQTLEYHFTDLGRTFVQDAQQEAARRGLDVMTFGVLDISRDPHDQGYDGRRFDLILGLNVVHATSNVSETIANLEKLLAPDGRICLVEFVKSPRWDNMIWGITEGWWLSSDGLRQRHGPLLDLAVWEKAFLDRGCSQVRTLPADHPERERTSAGLILARSPRGAPASGIPVEAIRPVSSLSVPLTSSQLEIWVASSLSTEASASFNLSTRLDLTGRLDVPALRRAIQLLVDHHDGLRLSFSPDGTSMVFAPAVELEIPLVDLSLPDAQDIEGRLEEISRAQSETPFDLTRSPLVRARIIRCGPERHVVLITIHHVVCDGYSFATLIRNLETAYAALSRGQRPPLKEAKQYSEYVRWKMEKQKSPDFGAAEAHYLSLFSDIPPALDLPTDRLRPSNPTFRCGEIIHRIDASLITGLRKIGVRHGASLFTTLLAALKVLLYRLSGQGDITVGVFTAGQSLVDGNDLVGDCVNTHALRSSIDRKEPFSAFLTRVQRAVLDMYDHSHYTLGDLLKKLKAHRDAGRNPLFSVEFNLERALGSGTFGDVRMEARLVPKSFHIRELSLNVKESEESAELGCWFNRDLYDRETVSLWVTYFEQLLRSILAAPEAPIGRLDLLPIDERRSLLAAGNDSAQSYPESRCVHELFEDQADRTPQAVAAVFQDVSITYGELNRRADRVARSLRSAGVQPEDRIGVCVERSLDMLTGLLGILKSGCAYVPLDPAFPRDRLATMLDDAGCRILLTQSGLMRFLSGAETRLAEDATPPSDLTEGRMVIPIDQELPVVDSPPPLAREPRSSDLAYVIYTSGSTGRPKGVEIPHRSVVNFLSSMRRRPGITPDDSLLAVTTLSFDIAVLELFLPLVSGARVIIASREEALDGSRLRELLRARSPTVMQATPATWAMLLDAGWPGSPQLRILCGGEELAPDLARKLLGMCGDLWNMYGPTETTVWSSVERVESVDGSIPLGKPIANTNLFILDEDLQPVPIGVPGELYIGGDGVARGYANRHDLTAERFVRNPLGDDPGSRLYRTGDLARYRPNGELQFLGRLDHQVKIRGYRIELGEIEETLRRHPATAEVVVLAREDAPGDKRLAAYLTSRNAEPPTTRQLREHLRERLPDYMVPSYFVILDRFPLTANGKIARQKLPKPDLDAAGSGTACVASRDTIELQLTNIWRKVLGVKRIGIKDDFFELGGHSLLALQLFQEIDSGLGRKLPLATLFQATTIEQLAEILRDETWEPNWKSLVPIREGGSRPPLFLVHGAEGNVLIYRRLAHHLGPDQPVYGLQSLGLGADGEVARSFEDMAVEYIREIRSLQPEGPYLLGGYCLGGTLALEMARQLRSQGETVALIALLETYNARAIGGVPSRAVRTCRAAQNLGYHVGNFSRIRAAGRWAFLREKYRVLTARTRVWLASRFRKRSYSHLMVRRANDHAERAYLPARYDGRVALFRPETHFWRLDDPKFGWGDLHENLDVYTLPFYPRGMLVEPFVQTLARRLDEAIEAALVESVAESPDRSPDSRPPALAARQP